MGCDRCRHPPSRQPDMNVWTNASFPNWAKEGCWPLRAGLPQPCEGGCPCVRSNKYEVRHHFTLPCGDSTNKLCWFVCVPFYAWLRRRMQRKGKDSGPNKIRPLTLQLPQKSCRLPCRLLINLQLKRSCTYFLPATLLERGHFRFHQKDF